MPIISGSITWKDGVHEVRSPVVVYTTLPSSYSIAIEGSKQPKKLIDTRGFFGLEKQRDFWQKPRVEYMSL